jgi:ABC-2 type transport system ATP-binding protein
MFDLTDAADDLIKSYSHGMKQKIVLTGALIHDPALWVLDEPMVGLDPKSAHLLKEQMREHCDKGNTVFFSTHVLEVAEKLCDRIGIIHKGRLIAIGTMDELRKGDNADSLENIFLELTEQ